MVSVVGLLGSLVVAVFSDTMKSASSARLTSDLKVLNSAVLAYLSSNGDLSSAKTAEEALAKLKLVASSDSANAFNGYRGGFLEAGVVPVYQTEKEAATDDPRIRWDSAIQRFSVVTKGVPGIKRFARDDDLASQDPLTETREGILSLAQEDKWIWDYTEAPPTFGPGPSQITAVPETSAGALPAALAPPPPPPAPPSTVLAPPTFSIPGGNYPISAFDLSLVLSNPNPAGSSDIYYRVDFGSWMPYTGSLSVTPNQTIFAQSISRNSGLYDDSTVTNGEYQPDPVPLSPPTIIPSQPGFGLFFPDDIEVSLQDVINAPGSALLQYRIDGSPWLDYTGGFILSESLYPTGVMIEARAISTGSPYYLPSTATFRSLARESLNVDGNTTGEFNNPLGASSMVTNLNAGDSSSYFTWGDVSGQGRSVSWMDFSGGTFTDIVDGAQFNVGALTYYNGTINADTGADTIDLDIVLDIDINGKIFRPFFDFTFDLINTPNTNDAIASADFVQLDDARSSRTLVYNEQEFEFRLEFGETTANGFSSFDQFHVIENEQASVNLYGSFTLLGPASGTSANDPISGGTVIINDSETGTITDPLYQKEGYIDPEQYSKSLAPLAEDARDAAESARDTAGSEEDITQKAKVDLPNKLDDEKYYEAFVILEQSRDAADAAEQAALFAEARAAEAEDYAVKAKEAALNDSAADDEALIVIEAAMDARLYADEARFFADDAASDLSIAESSWQEEIEEAPDENPSSYLAYLADRSANEEALARAARDQAEDFSADAAQADSDTARKIGEGKYDEAEAFYVLAAPAALASEEQAAIAEQAAFSARTLADEAVALNPSHSETTKAVRSADNAEAYAITARAAADAARAAALNAETLWEESFVNAATTDPENWANYLLYLADQQRRVAQDAAKEAEDARSDAEKASADAIKKAGEGKIADAQKFLANTASASALSNDAAARAKAAAIEARSFAIQAGLVAANAPVAQGAYDDALVEATDAETYANQANGYAFFASKALADAQAAMP